MEKYKALTLKEIIDDVESHKEDFPKGLDTVVMSGDFESNYTHEKHEIQCFETDKYGNVLYLGYEMHEDFEDGNEE